MDCLRVQNLASDYLDQELPSDTRLAVESHIKTCHACGLIYEDLRKIVSDMQALPTLEPVERLWPALEDRLSQEAPARPGRPGPGLLSKMPALWLSPKRILAAAAAAAVVVMLAWSLVWKWDVREKNHAEVARAEIRQAEMHYQKAIESLNQAISSRKPTWDPQVAQVFEANLKKVDQAIAECRDALQKYPDDVETETFLLAAYGQKVELLQEILQSGS